jgi:hypothetical protein
LAKQTRFQGARVANWELIAELEELSLAIAENDPRWNR